MRLEVKRNELVKEIEKFLAEELKLKTTKDDWATRLMKCTILCTIEFLQKNPELLRKP